MKKSLIKHAGSWAVALGIWMLFLTESGAAQYVELTAEIDSISWPLRDEEGDLMENPRRTTSKARCVVGTNTWLIENEDDSGIDTWWFSGTNLTWHMLSTGYPSKHKALYERNHPEQIGIIGKPLTKTFESLDGNPGRPVRTMDLLTGPNTRICWLAFCSGGCLKREGRRIFPPSDIWKETAAAITNPSGFADQTTLFEDGLGLPRSLDLHTTNQQAILQYRALLTTNVLGWDFPLEFCLAQYRPAGRRGWELDLTANGKITAIGVGTEPYISTETQKPVEK